MAVMGGVVGTNTSPAAFASKSGHLWLVVYFVVLIMEQWSVQGNLQISRDWFHGFHTPVHRCIWPRLLLPNLRNSPAEPGSTFGNFGTVRSSWRRSGPCSWLEIVCAMDSLV